ncbi:plasmid mobilization protein [Chitinophaga japonensis]|nr:plasmid mobilization relaxosome protein MobC [Chitinophaga japonensis]
MIIVMNGNNNKSRVVNFRMTPQEYARMESKWKRTTCRKLSDFIRHRVLDKPLVSTHRNRSLDDFMAEMALLRKELNSIGVNFNQAVHKLHMADTPTELKMWLRVFQKDRQILLDQVEKIKLKIYSIADEWLQ